MSVLSSILVLLVTSRLLGELMVRWKQPRILGEILAGIILGPACLKLIHANDHLAGISELSVFLIVLSAGLEMELKDVVNAIRGRGAVSSLLDFFIPLILGFFLGLVFDYDIRRSLFIGLCLSITALPVAIRILESFNLLSSRIARYSIATAILNDICALLFVGILLDMGPDVAQKTTLLSVSIAMLTKALKIVGFVLLIFAAARLLRWGSRTHTIENLMARIMRLFGREALFGVAILFVLFFGSFSEGLGTHFIIGAFFGALLLSRDVLGTGLFVELEQVLRSITEGFLAPVFFAFLGLSFSMHTFSTPYFLVAIVFTAMFSKIWAGWMGARYIKMPPLESLGVGIILNGRGIMELVVANIAYQRKFIDADLFSALVFVGIFTTVMTPLLFRRFVFSKLTAS